MDKIADRTLRTHGVFAWTPSGEDESRRGDGMKAMPDFAAASILRTARQHRHAAARLHREAQAFRAEEQRAKAEQDKALAARANALSIQARTALASLPPEPFTRLAAKAGKTERQFRAWLRSEARYRPEHVIRWCEDVLWLEDVLAAL